MALHSQSLFLYGFQVTQYNSSIDFQAVSAETPRQATLNIGYYSLTSLMQEIVRALQAVDANNTYTVTADRTIGGGLQNRVSIATSGTYLKLLFGSGSRAASTVAPLIGFNSTDYSGATTYTGSATAGTSLVPGYVGYNYQSPDTMQKVFGNLNVSASGVKEAVVFNVQKFWTVQFKYIPSSQISIWSPLMTWMMQQRLIEFTPEISSPTVFYEGTLDSSSMDGKGLGYQLKEMLPSYPDNYDTGPLKFRVRFVPSLLTG